MINHVASLAGAGKWLADQSNSSIPNHYYVPAYGTPQILAPTQLTTDVLMKFYTFNNLQTNKCFPFVSVVLNMVTALFPFCPTQNSLQPISKQSTVSLEGTESFFFLF